MRSGLLSDLVGSGYELFLEGDRIRYRYLKPGDPPETVKPLLDELKRHKSEVVKILRMGGSIVPPRKAGQQSAETASWPREVQPLVDWFMTLGTPTEPFQMGEHRRIVAPEKFFRSLRQDIEAGPEGPRGRHGIVIQDLTTLKKLLN